ncbi:sensor histidine kinase [Actinomadura sp. HBU206391]|uniref:sensor histidine kinase n=1 Tax=Actinomadura sp. HBU206391 TaxID=2731692 RepID=UPI0016500412|nr:sensor histidine kinase [Actinomadura sp. HBU206391]MBC6457077.1 sensor histidine kinase [Actinomadura sp. HBU206391]
MVDGVAGDLRTWAGRATVRDTGLALALLAACVVLNDPNTAVRKHAGSGFGPPWPAELWIWWGATLIAVLGTALRHRWPLPLLALCAGAATVHLALAPPLTIVDLAAPILLHTVAISHRRTVSVVVLAGLGATVVCWSAAGMMGTSTSMTTVEVAPTAAPAEPMTVSVQRMSRSVPASAPLVIVSVLVAAWATGSGARSRAAYLSQLRARAVALERERDQQAELAVATERSRISRELHDVVAHGLSVIVIQAQGGHAALDNRTGDARRALEAIITTGRGALAEMRHVLTSTGQINPALHPQPGLAHLPQLIDQVNTTAIPVTLRVEGTPTPLPPSTDLAAYRIVQEALTNTMKHAGERARARILVSYDDSGVRLDISDDGSGSNGGISAGQGLRGMRERVGLLGGDLHAGPGPHGGFVVHARLPLDGAAR